MWPSLRSTHRLLHQLIRSFGEQRIRGLAVDRLAAVVALIVGEHSRAIECLGAQRDA